MVWLPCLLAFVILVVALVLLPVRVHVSCQGRGEPNGAWGLAAGAQVGPLALSGVAGRDVAATVQLHLFRWRIWSRDVRSLLRRRAREGAGRRGPLDRYRSLERWFDPLEVAKFLAGEHRRARIESFAVDLDYSFADVALTGKLMGATYALDGMLPPAVRIRQKVSWEVADRASVALVGSIRTRPGLMAVDAVVFSSKNLRLFHRRPKPPGATEST